MCLAIGLNLSGCATTEFQKDPKGTAELKTQIAAEHLKSGNVDAAKVALDDALSKDPNNSLALMSMGLTYQLVGNRQSTELADRYFKRASTLEPKNPQIRNNYGQYLYSVKRYEDAIKEFSVAAHTIGYPHREVALSNLGKSYLQIGNYNSAIDSLLDSIRINNTQAETLLNLAEAQYKNGDVDSASVAYDDFLIHQKSNQSTARSIWIGIIIDRANKNFISMNKGIEKLTELYPDSAEFKLYNEQKNSNKAWN